MTDTVASPFPFRITGPTAPIRARRAREKKHKTVPATKSEFVNLSNAGVTEQPSPGRPKTHAAPTRVRWPVWPLAAVTVGLMIVSLTDLSGGVIELTHIRNGRRG
jgi:hypothetical protein